MTSATKINSLLSILDDLYSIQEIKTIESAKGLFWMYKEKYPITLPDHIKFNGELMTPFNLNQDMKENQFKLLLSILVNAPCHKYNYVFHELTQSGNNPYNEKINWLAYYIATLLYKNTLEVRDYVLLYRLLGCRIHTADTNFLQVITTFELGPVDPNLRIIIADTLKGNYDTFVLKDAYNTTCKKISQYIVDTGISRYLAHDFTIRIMKAKGIQFTYDDFLELSTENINSLVMSVMNKN